ncbi:MAG: ABC transporter permease [Clostridia bacterium]|nr:ABC transporter permease [Clostridia bacterium]
MRIYTFSKRTMLEIIRDPLTLIFGIGFPVILILLLSAIQANIPVPLFEIERLAPSMCVFGLSFMTLFSAQLIAKDRESAFLTRLYATPMRAHEFILGYTLPLLPIALAQTALCYILGLILGMTPTWNIIPSMLLSLPISVFFISLGLLFGSLMTQKQVGGICGALLTNLSAFLSGIWFDLELVGGAFKAVAEALPFWHGVRIQTESFLGNFGAVGIDILIVSAYALVALVASVFAFIKQMRK